MRILAIETSCDETAIAFLEVGGGLKNPRFKILKNLVASQIKIHAPFGGVVPNLAKREHLKNLPILLKKMGKLNPKEIDLIGVTVGPGLEPCLWTGINFAKDLYKNFKIQNPKIKIVGTNHLEGHLYSFLLQQKAVNSKFKTQNLNLLFPATALIISGGHTILLLMKDLFHWKKLGETRDDAVGESFDKVARLLNLSYPGGPEIEKLAKESKNPVPFPRPMLDQKNYDFSYSGLKTAVLYFLRDSNITQKMRINANITNKNLQYSRKLADWHYVADVAAGFQEAAFDVLIKKTIRAVKEFGAKSILISGGVAINNFLRKSFKHEIKKENLKISFLAPDEKFCQDNAAMIAAAGYLGYLKKKNHTFKARGNLSI